MFAWVASGSSKEPLDTWSSTVQVQELVIDDESSELRFISDLKELEARATEGANSCSVVAWLLNIHIDQKNMEFVLIGNDVTHQVGSFAQPEHRLFEMASKLAREKQVNPLESSDWYYDSLQLQIPRINISCNSGARIGLARDVLDVLKVKLKSNGHDFDYLYVDATEKERIGSQIVYKQHENELRIKAVKGKKVSMKYVQFNLQLSFQNEYIGVENLMGSGAIGGETSRAYREIPTYCYVTGRSVGIGAYTARLARRIIQHEKAHLILTGSAALNTLLGKKVCETTYIYNENKIQYFLGVCIQQSFGRNRNNEKQWNSPRYCLIGPCRSCEAGSLDAIFTCHSV